MPTDRLRTVELEDLTPAQEAKAREIIDLINRATDSMTDDQRRTMAWMMSASSVLALSLASGHMMTLNDAISRVAEIEATTGLCSGDWAVNKPARYDA